MYDDSRNKSSLALDEESELKSDVESEESLLPNPLILRPSLKFNRIPLSPVPTRRILRKTSLERLPGDGDWVNTVTSVLGSDCLSAIRQHFHTLTYGSDCSGIDAPCWALRQLLGDQARRVLSLSLFVNLL